MFNIFKKKIKLTSFNKRKLLADEIAQAKDAQGFYNFLQKLPNPDIILRSSGLGYSSLRNLKANYQVGTCIESRKAGVTFQINKINKIWI